MSFSLARVLLGVVLSATVACNEEPDVFRDQSNHDVRFVSVQEGVELEVLDWGGQGRPLVLLSGMGNTAHVYDHLAQELNRDHRVVGITRRGFGASSWPGSGYSSRRLGEDVYAVIKALGLDDVVLVGHSLAGDEMTFLGARQVAEVAGLVYLDAAYNRKANSEDPEFKQLLAELPQLPPIPPEPEKFEELFGYPMLEVELRNPPKNEKVWGLVKAGFAVPEYADIKIPMLAIYAAARSVDNLEPWLISDDPARIELLEALLRHQTAQRERAINEFRKAVDARVVVIEGAGHYVFLTHEDRVLRELRGFLRELDADST